MEQCAHRRESEPKVGSPYPSKEAVPQAIVPPLALSARRRKLRRRKHDKGGKRVGGRHISEEKIKFRK